MTITVSTYLQQVSNAWKDRNSTRLSDLLSFQNQHVKNAQLQIEEPESQVEMYLDPPIDEIVAGHIKCIWAVSVCDFAQAYTCQTLIVQCLIKCFQTHKDDNWLLPIMNVVCLDLRLIAIKADSSNKSKSEAGKPREALEKAAELLMACFRICAGDNRTSDKHTKKWGMMPLVNQLFKVYFRINKLHLMKPLIRAIESSPLKDRFLISQQITYKYFVGRKAMFDSDYKSANDYLSFAFEHCHKASKKNKRLILIYLVPVKILLGYMPTKTVLKKYDLMQLWEVVEAVKCGKVYQLTNAMQNHQTFFIRCGIYLILEKLKIITYRNLFKKVYLISKTPVISMETLLAALRIMDNQDTELEEAHCILANLISEGKVKGYISFGHQKVVLSKTDPFPKLSTLF